MKSYTLPAIIAASVIAIATLFYALVFQGQDPEQAESVIVENSVIAEPTQNSQTSVSPASAVSDEATPEQKGRLIIDIARVQADGMAVFAGQGAPYGTIYITENGAVFAQNSIDDKGQWVVLPEAPLSPGAHLLQLEMVTLEGTRERADVSLVVEISEDGSEKPLVAVVPQSDEASPQVLQMPDEDKETITATTTTTAPAKDDDLPKSEAEEVAEILGQDDIFIQIGSLSWNESGALSVHGVASGGDLITGAMAGQPLAQVILSDNGRWSSYVQGDPFATGDRQRLDVVLTQEDGEELARAQLAVSQSQLSAGLDGSVMVVVHKGDALWRIAYRSYGQGVRYVDIVRRNSDKINDPDLIYPNQIFAVPGLKTE